MISFPEDQILALARSRLSNGDHEEAVNLLQRAHSDQARALLGEAVYGRGKQRASAGEYRNAKEDFALAAQQDRRPIVRSLAQERSHLLNEILGNRMVAVADLGSRLANLRVSQAIAMPPDSFAPLVSYVACPAAYRSGYDPQRSDPLSRLIRLAKRGVKDSTIERLGEILAGYAYTETPILKDCDFIVPVPPDVGRSTERGYSIPMLLAAKVAMSCAVPLHPEVVEAAGPLPELRRVPRWARAMAIEDAYRGTDRAVRLEGMNVVVVDDVVTSGATLHEVAKVLLGWGAQTISALVLAHTERSA